MQLLTFGDKREVRQVCRPDSVRQANLAGNHSSGLGIAAGLWPSTRMLGRAALPGIKPDACLFDVAPGRGCRVSPCCAVPGCPDTQHGDGRVGAHCCARAADSSLWPCSSTRRCRNAPPCRTAVSRYPALWSPDLPRCQAPRLPDLPHAAIVTCDNSVFPLDLSNFCLWLPTRSSP